MLTKEHFITLMKSLENIDKVINGVQNIFDFNMDEGPLVKAFDDIAALIIDEMELEVDDEVGPVIYNISARKPMTFRSWDEWRSIFKNIYFCINNIELVKYMI